MRAAANSSRSWDWRAQISERSWELSPEHEPELRKRQREHDILKTRARERQQERSRNAIADGDGEVEGDGGVSSLSELSTAPAQARLTRVKLHCGVEFLADGAVHQLARHATWWRGGSAMRAGSDPSWFGNSMRRGNGWSGGRAGTGSIASSRSGNSASVQAAYPLFAVSASTAGVIVIAALLS